MDNASDECGAMDMTAYLIKDDLPQAVVRDLPQLIDRIPGIKLFIDFHAYVLIEFRNKADANSAKSIGFNYQFNGRDLVINFATASRVATYVQDKYVANTGKGF